MSRMRKRMVYEIDVGKHNDKHIKRATKDATKLSEEKAMISYWYFLSLFFSHQGSKDC
jgi:hypothetical protein